MKQHRELEEEKQELQSRKEEYQRDLERLRDAQRKLKKDSEAVQRQLEKMEEIRLVEVSGDTVINPSLFPLLVNRTPPFLLQRTPSTTSDESQFAGSSQSLELDPVELSSSLAKLQPQRSKPKGKSLNPFSSSSSNPNVKGGEGNNQISKSLLQLAKNKSKDKEKKKKKGKGGTSPTTGGCEGEAGGGQWWSAGTG